MSIVLKPEHEQLVQAQLATGKYATADDVIIAALKLLEREQQLEALRQKIAIGTDQIQRGQVVDGETVFAQLQAKITQMSKQAET
ncbi:MAG: type II toxin-antitoxin system ParD family antitoxin [Lyngbya sp. HA4199-MV5]|jgi:antitoxin ParD1/3/4|nr:type II toxin-antitoxin system ParD family antitoxin [Lyngbya sp. HA4199-MV5]